MISKLEELFGLKSRLAIVTGGANGIGAGIAETLAGAGATIVIVDMNADAAQAQARRLSDAGHTAFAAAFDISDETAVIAGLAGIVERHGAPWILVNNAGIQNRKAFFEIDAEFLDRYHAVNARGTFLMMRESAKAMIAAGRGGRIVNIATLGVLHQMLHGLVAYQSSKGSVMAQTKAVALELLGENITVNAVLPGGTITPGAAAATGPAPAGPATRGFPLGLCEPADMAAAVLYLASPAAKRVTGQSIAVDSGFLLS